MCRKWILVTPPVFLALALLLGRETDAPKSHAPPPTLTAHSEPQALRTSVAVDPDWLTEVRKSIQRDLHQIQVRPDGVLITRNGALQMEFRPDGAQVLTGRGSIRWGLAEIRQAEPAERATLEHQENRVFATHGPITELWENRPDGIEHTLTVREAPPDASPLVVRMPIQSTLVASSDRAGTRVHFADPDGLAVLTYRDLKVFDADRRVLPSRMSVHDGAIEIVVADRGARYPITIDPLLTPADWTSSGNDQATAYYGISVETAGDVNDDTYDDVIVGAWYWDSATETDVGKAYVYHGSATGLSTMPDWTTDSGQLQAYYATSVSTAGDVNDDGFDDVIVGAHQYENGEVNEGRAFVYHGSATGLSTMADWTAESDQADSSFGFSVSTAGDVNGDGIADVIVGNHLYDNGEIDEGQALVYYGATTTGLSTMADWTFESDQATAYFGYSVSAAGDVNDDGVDDVIIGAHLFDNGETDEGRAFVFHGSSTTGLSTMPDWTAESDQADSSFGISVDTAGDVNGDGIADVIVGNYLYDNGEIDEGQALVYYGATTSGLSTIADWTVEIDQANAQFGRAVATAGDVNNDGYSDVLVGADYYENGEANEGGAFLYHGSSLGLSLKADWIGESDQADARYGNSVASAGDIDNDGLDDVIVGASYYNETNPDSGKAYVYLGTGSGDPVPNDPTNLDQFRADATTSIPLGGATIDTTVVLKAIVGDPGDSVKLQVEVQPVGTVFTDTFTAESALLVSGSVAEASVTGLADDSYHWQARAVDALDQTSAWVSFGGNSESAVDFIIDTTTPGAFTLEVPQDASLIGDSTPIFDWIPAPDATAVTYQILVDDSGSGFPSPEIDESGLTGSSFTPASALGDATYSWKVVATDALGSSTETGVWTFTIDATPPATFSKIAPPNGASFNDAMPDFDWTDSSDPNGLTYHLLVDNGGSGFLSPEISDSGLTTSDFTPTVPLPDGTYSWKVIASDSLGNETATTVSSFTIDTLPPAITSIDPSPPTGTAPLPVNFLASAVDDGGLNLYQWDFDGDGAIDYTSSRSPSISFTYAAGGTFTATLTVTDLAGNTETDSVTITVTTLPAPGASLTALPGAGPVPLAVDFEVLKPPANTVAYEWNFDGDMKFDLLTHVPTATHTYLLAGKNDPIVRLVSSDGTVSFVSGLTITATAPLPPTPTTALISRIFVDADGNTTYDAGSDPLVDEDLTNGLEGNTYFFAVGQAIGFQGKPESGSEVDQWLWDFNGDSTFDLIGAGSDPIEGVFSYAAPGTYTATLRIEYLDATGNPQGAVETTVTVSVAPATSFNRKVQIMGPATNWTIAGDRVTFTIQAQPKIHFDVGTIQLQFFDGGTWSDLEPYVTDLTNLPELFVLTVDILAAVNDGVLTENVTTYFRARATSQDGEVVVSANDPLLSQTGVQGLVMLTPVNGAGLEERVEESGVVQRLELRPGHAIDTRVGTTMRLRISATGIPPEAATLEIRVLDPAGLVQLPRGVEFFTVYEITLRDAAAGVLAPLENPTIEVGPLSSAIATESTIWRFGGTSWSKIQDLSMHEDDGVFWGTAPGLGTLATVREGNGVAASGGGGGKLFCLFSAPGETTPAHALPLLLLLAAALAVLGSRIPRA